MSRVAERAHQRAKGRTGGASTVNEIVRADQVQPGHADDIVTSQFVQPPHGRGLR